MLGLARYVSRRAPSNVFLAMWPRVSGHALQSVFRCSSFIRLSVWLLFQTILPDALSCESFLVGWVFCKNLRTAYIARVSWNNIHELFLLVLHVWSTTLDVYSIAFLDLIKTFLLDIFWLLYQQFIWMWLVFLLRFLTSPSPNSTECPNSHWEKSCRNHKTTTLDFSHGVSTSSINPGLLFLNCQSVRASNITFGSLFQKFF